MTSTDKMQAMTTAQKTKKKSPPVARAEDPPELIEGTPDQRMSAQQRADECSREVAAVLAKYSCLIAPFMDVEPVGNLPGGKMMVDATRYRILPRAE